MSDRNWVILGGASVVALIVSLMLVVWLSSIIFVTKKGGQFVAACIIVLIILCAWGVACLIGRGKFEEGDTYNATIHKTRMAFSYACLAFFAAAAIVLGALIAVWVLWAYGRTFTAARAIYFAGLGVLVFGSLYVAYQARYG